MFKEETTLGDICKWFEKNFSPDIMIPELPVIIRLDGNNFHSWTKDLKSPYDERLSSLMIECAKFLIKETNGIVSYQQSDELSVILYSNDLKSLIYQDGKKQKICSKLTSKLINFFNQEKEKYGLGYKKYADFDCRVYQTPTLEWAVKQLLWREIDATKNSISMAAQSMFPHSVLQGLHGNEMQEKMFTEKGVNWNNYPDFFKKGTYVKRIKTSRKFTQEELDALPEKHQAKNNPDLVIERNIIQVIDIPKLSSIKNKVGFFFNNEEIELF